jgi:hypothetical protein
MAGRDREPATVSGLARSGGQRRIEATREIATPS